MVEVELLQALAGREPGGPDAALAAVGLPGGDLALQAGDQELLVRPGLGPGPLGQPGDRLAQRRGLQGAGQERDLGGHVAGSARLGRWPSRHRRRVEAERGVVVAQGPDLDLGSCGAGRGQRRPLLAQRRRGLARARGSVMVWCLAQQRAWSATTRPVAGHPHPVQVGDHLDPAADHGRVHGVVVGVQADVVVTGQPDRGPPPDQPGRPAATPASRPGRRPSAPSGRSPTPAGSRVFASASQPPSWALKSAGRGERPAGQERRSPGSRWPARPGPWPPGRAGCRRSP